MQQKSFGGTEGEVLIVNFTDWIPRAKLDGVLSKAFAVRGCIPIVLTSRACTWSQRYLRACGVEKFLFLEDLLSCVPEGSVQRDVEDLLSRGTSFRDLFPMMWEGVDVGRHILSTVLQHRRQGSFTPDDPQVYALLRKLLTTSLRVALAVARLFDEKHPRAVLFFERGYTPYGELFDIALRRSIDVIQCHHAQRSDLVVLKRYTVANRHKHCFSLGAVSWERVKAMPWTREQEDAFMDELKKSYEGGTWFNRKFLLEGKKLKSPEEVRVQLHLNPNKKTAVIFSHVLWDATFFFGESLFPDYEQWLVATVRVACENRAVNWVVKLHPDYVWKMKTMGASASPRDVIALEANIGELPSHIQIVPPDTDISTYSFFPITDYCITVRGTIGIEAPCFGIPVFTAGTGRYSGLGFTNDSMSQEEYLEKMRHIQNFPPLSNEERAIARRHAYALFHLRPLPFTSCEIVPKGSGSFEQEAVIRLHSLKNLEQAEDLQIFTSWVLDSKEEDYLRVPEARQLTPL